MQAPVFDEKVPCMIGKCPCLIERLPFVVPGGCQREDRRVEGGLAGWRHTRRPYCQGASRSGLRSMVVWRHFQPAGVQIAAASDDELEQSRRVASLYSRALHPHLPVVVNSQLVE